MADESAYNQFQDDIQQPATENDDPSELYGLDPDSYTVRRLVRNFAVFYLQVPNPLTIF